MSPSPREAATISCFVNCGALLSGSGRLAGKHLEIARIAHQTLEGSLLSRLPFALEAFLYDEQEWLVSCEELEPLRTTFEEYGAEELFGRLWSVALTNEPDPNAFASARNPSCAHRAALAFEELRACLDNSTLKPAKAVRAVVTEIKHHSEPGSDLAQQYERLLLAALAAVHAPKDKAESHLSSLARECHKVFDQYGRQYDAAWWPCGRLFLAEALRRLEKVAGIPKTAAYGELLRMTLDAPQAALLMARSSGSAEPLRSVHFQGSASEWRAFLERRIDAGMLGFDDRVRYEIARLKLLRAQARPVGDDQQAEARALLSAFESLQGFLARGVPPRSRQVPALVQSPLVDFYITTVEDLDCAGAALRTTEDLLRRRPDDFRLACLYATGAVVAGEPGKLSLLAKYTPRRNVDPELFARSALTWVGSPHGARAALIIRPSLFDPLDREHRKQCLIKLSQQCLRSAASAGQYTVEIRKLLPYFERDNFVYRDLQERAAVESSLVFLATMMAPLHDLKLALTEEQSQQWVSHAREIARQSPLGSELALRYLKSPTRWFTLDRAVRNTALGHLRDFQPPGAKPEAPPPRAESTRPKRRRRRKHTDATSPSQRGLFDDP
jgi:hypothetical protein